MKKCVFCEAEYPASSFDKSSSSKDGFHAYCKACSIAVGRKNRHKRAWRKFGTVKPRKRANIVVEIKYAYKSGKSILIKKDHMMSDAKYSDGYVSYSDGAVQFSAPVEPWDIWRYA